MANMIVCTIADQWRHYNNGVIIRC